jgi:hypothetical protein
MQAPVAAQGHGFGPLCLQHGMHTRLRRGRVIGLYAYPGANRVMNMSAALDIDEPGLV